MADGADGGGSGQGAVSIGVSTNQNGGQGGTTPAETTSVPVGTIPSYGLSGETTAPAVTGGVTIDIVPEEFRKEQWVQNAFKTENPMPELFKQFKGAQAKIGERPTGLQPPGPDSTPEQIKEFHKAIGIPDDIKPYELPKLEVPVEDKPISDYLEKNRSPQFLDSLKTKARELGVTPKQFAELAKHYDSEFIKTQKDTIKQMANLEAELDQDFKTKMNKHFGQRTDQVITRGNQMMRESLPPEFFPMLASASNDTLVLVAAVANSLAEKYVHEDNSLSTKGTAMNGAKTELQIRKEASLIMASPAWGANTPEGKEAAAQVKQLYAQVQAIHDQGKGKRR